MQYFIQGLDPPYVGLPFGSYDFNEFFSFIYQKKKNFIQVLDPLVDTQYHVLYKNILEQDLRAGYNCKIFERNLVFSNGTTRLGQGKWLVVMLHNMVEINVVMILVKVIV